MAWGQQNPKIVMHCPDLTHSVDEHNIKFGLVFIFI